LIHQKLADSLKRLDDLKNLKGIDYLPITTEIMRKAAELWGWARSTGQSTAQSAALDGDVILAATAIIAAQKFQKKVLIATTNVKDLQRYYTDTYHWDDTYWAI
jgi:predicted nucleic acid-binding protein